MIVSGRGGIALRGAMALMAAAACVALGLWAARRLARREEMLNAWEGALLRMEGAVTHSGAGLRDVLKAGARDELPVLGELALRLQQTPAAGADALLSGLPWNPLLTDAERNALLECLRGLFSPTLTSQAQAIAYALEQWAVFRRLGREAMDKNGRLYVNLGWLSGAALFILLC